MDGARRLGRLRRRKIGLQSSFSLRRELELDNALEVEGGRAKSDEDVGRDGRGFMVGVNTLL